MAARSASEGNNYSLSLSSRWIYTVKTKGKRNMNGLYIGATGALNHMQHLNVHSNNITNASTPGFKFDSMTSSIYSTHQTLAQLNNGAQRIGSMDNKVVPTETHVNLTQGTTMITNRQMDFFLDDKEVGSTSFFVVERNGETFLTRNGNFGINADGFLTTANGDYVLDADNQRIRIPNNRNITVDITGRVFDEGGNQLTQLQTRAVDSELADSLVKHADGRFTLNGTDITALPQGTAQMHNGILESSNVDMANEMVELMKNQKMVNSSSSIMKTMHAIHEKEVNIGRG